MTEDQRIHLDGYIDVPADRMATVEAALVIHIDLTREEVGCVSFEVIPCKTVEGRFLVSEIFTNQATFDDHQTRAKASAWFAASDGLAREYTIRVGGES
ncbi:MAG: antibiotic biosynthesis monooxygenase [Rhizobiales bacterium]|nr:antibiotic biosynthesis monooxygenase [Hyphomicrobiales bacterium]NRB13724.1 antibiotic biosynthesis monooxygenase [Hyphomicrobiales bacterium]